MVRNLAVLAMTAVGIQTSAISQQMQPPPVDLPRVSQAVARPMQNPNIQQAGSFDANPNAIRLAPNVVPNSNLANTATVATGASQLQVYDLPVDMVGTVAAQLQMRFINEPSVKITTEPQTGRLMVLGSPRAQEFVAGQVQQIRAALQASNPNAPIEVFPTQQRSYVLRHVGWQTLEDTVQRLAGPRMTVTTLGNGEVAQMRIAGVAGMQDVLQVDRRTNEVVLQGTSRNVAAWMQVVAAVDSPSQMPRAAFMELGAADPEKIGNALKLVRASFQEDAEEDEEAVIDVNDPTGDVTGISSIGDASDSGVFGDVKIEFVPELGFAIVQGNARDVKRVQELIEKIKRQSEETQPELEVYPLEYINSTAIATVVKQLYEEILAARQGNVSITALVQPNSLLLIGRKEAIASLKQLLEKLDQPLDPASQLRVFRLVHASSVDAEETIRSFFVEQPGTDDELRSGIGTRVSVVSDFRTNSLIVQASPRDMSEVARLIQEIDVESTAAQNEIRVFPLRNAIAEELEPVLQTAISGPEDVNEDARPISSKLTLQATGRGSLDSDILAGVVVTSNPSINALVVRAPSKSMPLIAELIQQLDQLPSAEALIKVFEVRNSDATTLATSLQQLFGLPVTAGNSTGGIFGLGNQANQLAALTAGGDSSLVQLRIAVDVRTNAIIVSGSRSDLEVIEVLLLRLDEDGVESRKTEVVWLRNSNATDIANAIQTFLNQQRQLYQQNILLNQTVNAYDQLDREILVQAEPSTNSLIISASPKYYQQIMEVIERLDRQPPMIHVDVLLAEVTLEDTFEFGVEWGLQDALLFDRGSATGGTLGSPGFNINAPLSNTVTAGRPSQTAGQAISSFAIGRSNSSLGYGGLVLSAASDSVSALLRTLQDANRLQILSRPSVTTIDNVEGFVQVGAQVPRVQGVTAGGVNVGQTITTSDVPVGLILRILPRTNQDGMILLNVSVTRSSVGPTETGIPVGFGPGGEVIRSPIINETTAVSRISAMSGQTVVYAGLITKSRGSRSRRVPFLADIPLAGALFRFDSESETRTELLVVLTPRIVNSEFEMNTINQVESSRMSWCLADVLNIHGDTSLSEGNGLWGPAASPVIYPDMNPTILDNGFAADGIPASFIFPAEPDGMPLELGTETINSFPSDAPVEIAPMISPSSYPAANGLPNPVVPASTR